MCQWSITTNISKQPSNQVSSTRRYSVRSSCNACTVLLTAGADQLHVRVQSDRSLLSGFNVCTPSSHLTADRRPSRCAERSVLAALSLGGVLWRLVEGGCDHH